jgi:glycosyltransferase involved in cell wall biosynthesis
MHLIIYTQYYPPEIGAPQVRLHDLAIGLKRKGIQVSVLTAMPNYPFGKIYVGYEGCSRVEYIDGIRVIRTGIFPTHSAGFLPRLLSYFSFILSSLVIGSWKLSSADFLLTESPPLFLGIAGVMLSRMKHARWIFNVSDLWPESVVELGIVSRESLSYKLSSVLEKYLYKKAFVVTGQSNSILKNIHDRFPDVCTYHIPNGVDTSLFQPLGDQLKDENFHVLYAGLHGLAQGLEQIILAAQKLSSKESIDFTFVGDGPEKKKLIKLAKSLHLTNLNFKEPIVKEKIPNILRSANAIIVPLKIQLTGAIPSKLYEAMSIGKPIILIALSEAEQIVNDAKCGIVVHPGNIDELVAAIIHLVNNPEACKVMGNNGRQAAVQNHDRKRIVDDFAHFLTKEYLRYQ